MGRKLVVIQSTSRIAQILAICEARLYRARRDEVALSRRVDRDVQVRLGRRLQFESRARPAVPGRHLCLEPCT
jgi:hypothetical protein